MLIVAPITIVVQHWRRGRREWSLLSLPIIGLGCSFTLVTAFIVKHIDHDARVNEFMSSGVAMGQALQRTLEISYRDLMALHAFFYNITPNHDEFHHFSAATARTQRPGSLLQLGALRYATRERSTFRGRHGHQAGLSGFRIYDLQEDGSHAPASGQRGIPAGIDDRARVSQPDGLWF